MGQLFARTNTIMSVKKKEKTMKIQIKENPAMTRTDTTTTTRFQIKRHHDAERKIY